MDKIESKVRLSWEMEGGKLVMRSIAIWEKGLVEVSGGMGLSPGFEGC